MRVRWLVVLAAGGCHQLFDLDHVADVDARQDAAHEDAPADMEAPLVCPITPAEYDEDGDGIDDRCDACPTKSATGADTDTDGLPDECDPDLAPAGDRILLAVTFGRQSELAVFGPGVYVWSSDGTVTLAGNGRIATADRYSPTRIEVALPSGISGSAATGVLDLQAGGVTCTLYTGECGGGSVTKTCMALGNFTATSNVASTQLREINLFSKLTDIVCEGVDVFAGGPVLTVAGSLADDSVGLATNAQASTVVQSLVVYGSK